MSAASSEFWKCFSRRLSVEKEDAAPHRGLVSAVLCGKKGPSGLGEPPAPARFWVPIRYLKEIGSEIHIIGPMRPIGGANKRKPGVLQTINLLADAGSEVRRIKILALASLHYFISLGAARSAAAHDVASQIISELGLELHPSGWSTRTWLTLPSQQSVSNIVSVDMDISALADAVAAQVSDLQKSFVPVDVRFRDVRDAHAKTWREINAFLFDLAEPTASAGSFDWRMMTPGKMEELVWSSSLVELGEKFGVSDNAVKKYCKAKEIPLPSSGYWRMAEETRSGIQKLVESHQQDHIARDIWTKPLTEVAREAGVTVPALTAFCRQRGVRLPTAAYWRMPEGDRVAIRRVEFGGTG